MLVEKMLLFDHTGDEETLFLVEFENDEEREEIEMCIYSCKRSLPGEWTFDDILEAIQNNFEVKNITEICGFEQMGI